MMTRGLAMLVLALGMGGAGCLEYSPYDASVCRTGSFERRVLVDGQLIRERTFLPFDDDGDDLSQCSSVDALVIQGAGTSEDLEDLGELSQVGRLEVGPTTGLDDLGGLDGLASISSDLSMVDNAELASISGLGALIQVGGGIAIEDNRNLSLCAVESMLSELEPPPDTISVAGVEPCDVPSSDSVDLGTGTADQLFLMDGVVFILDVELATTNQLLVTGVSGNVVELLDEQRGMLASTSTPALDAQGVTISTDPAGALGWSVFYGGDWPLSFRDEVQLRFSRFEDNPQTAVYAGWVANEARIGDITVQRDESGEGLWIGTVGADGVPTAPARVDLPELRDVAAVVAVKAVRRDRVWVLVRSGGDVFSEHRIVLVDLDDASRTTSAVVGRGPVGFDDIALRSDGVVLTGRRIDDGNVVVGDADTIGVEGDFSFLVRVAGASDSGPQGLFNADQGLVSFPDGAGGSRAPDCLADNAGSGVVFMGTDLSADDPVGRIGRIDEDRFSSASAVFDMYSVESRPPLGLPFDRQLGCHVVGDGRLVVSGLDTFARGGSGREVGWRLSGLETTTFRARVQELTIGRIRGGVEQVQSTVSSNGAAVLYGPVPTSLNLTGTEVLGMGGRVEVFISTRQIFDPIR